MNLNSTLSIFATPSLSYFILFPTNSLNLSPNSLTIVFSTDSFVTSLISPLKLAEIYAAIANKGVYFKPQVARAIVDVDGKVIKEFEPEIGGQVEADQRTWDFLNRSLRMVVTQGTAAGVFSAAGVLDAGSVAAWTSSVCSPDFLLISSLSILSWASLSAFSLSVGPALAV